MHTCIVTIATCDYQLQLFLIKTLFLFASLWKSGVLISYQCERGLGSGLYSGGGLLNTSLAFSALRTSKSTAPCSLDSLFTSLDLQGRGRTEKGIIILLQGLIDTLKETSVCK